MKFSKFLLLSFLLICFSTACITETKKVKKSENYGGDVKTNPPVSENTPKISNESQEEPTPNSFSGQEIVFKGENAKIRIEADLKTSLENQEPPNLWFEYKDEKGDLVKKEISDEIKEIIENKWKTHLIYLYHKNITDNKDAIYESTFSNSMERVNSLDKLEKLEIDLPKKRKTFARDEIEKLLSLQERLANERFEELAKHFNK